MALLNIDETKCKRDGICAAECPAQIIVQADKKSFPTLLENGEEFCINCGHCVAVCPYEAISHANIPLGACPPIEKALVPDAAIVRQVLLTRRSIRQFKKTPVSHQILTELITTARYAPTGSNRQQVNWMVFQNPEEVHELAAMVIDFTRIMIPLTSDDGMLKRFRRIVGAWENGRDRIMRGAPHLIVTHSPSELSFPAADCAIALTYLELYAHAKGLGTCWAGYFTAAANAYDPLIAKLALPPGHQCFGAVMLGHPQHRYHRIPQRNEPLITWR
ncbi:MAG: nitroreductase family protein [Deltaproteobacteria bacterium]